MPEDAPGQPAPKPVDVFETAASMMEIFATLAWQKMGLQPDIATGKTVRDMKQAKAAVDAVAALAAIVEPELEDEQERRSVQNLLRDLRINYVEKSGEK
jgi:hypothetical protein